MRIILIVIGIAGIVLLAWIFFERNPLLNDELLKAREMSESSSEKSLLLPDISILPPAELYIENVGGVKKIRFSTIFYNQGEGSLELIGKPDKQKQVINASQRIIAAGGSSVEREVGKFILHPDHEHWHIEEYVVFELWSLGESKGKDELLATTQKMSFCIWDQEAYDLSLENAPQDPHFLSCNSEAQGLSVGWSDTYLAKVEGQELDITSIPDGNYLISSKLNPDKKIMESNYDNNEIVLEIEIAGNTIIPK